MIFIISYFFQFSSKEKTTRILPADIDYRQKGPATLSCGAFVTYQLDKA
jgi:hypothetical protein